MVWQIEKHESDNPVENGETNYEDGIVSARPDGKKNNDHAGERQREHWIQDAHYKDCSTARDRYRSGQYDDREDSSDGSVGAGWHKRLKPLWMAPEQLAPTSFSGNRTDESRSFWARVSYLARAHK
jgi:hypothetical protein